MELLDKGMMYDAKIKQMLLNNLTEDKIFQKKIMNLINSYYQKKLSFSERIFSPHFIRSTFLI